MSGEQITGDVVERDDAAEKAAEAEFNSGFDTTDQRPATETPQPVQDEATKPGETQPASAPAQQQEQPAPKYVQITEEDFERLKSGASLAEKLKDTADRSFGTAFGKIGGIERELQTLRQGAKRVTIDHKTIETLRGEIPELADALEQINGLAAVAAAPAVDETKLEELVQARVSPLEQKFETRIVLLQHPDMEAIKKSPDFHAYVQALPAEESQVLLNTWDSTVISGHLTKFKQQQAQRKQPQNQPGDDTARRSRMQAAVTPRGNGAQAPAPSELDEFNAGFSGR